MIQDADILGQGELVHSVPTEINQTKDMLIKQKMITEEQIKRQAHTTWVNARLLPTDPASKDKKVSVIDPLNNQKHQVLF